jgi:AAA+ superfamily predicted ATPase
MAPGEDPVRALREALRHSPGNVPLRKHLAETCAAQGRHEEAEKEYREALALAPDRDDLKLGLAHAFWQQGKSGEALVLSEGLVRRQPPDPAACLLHARLLRNTGDLENAARAYVKAVELDPRLADPGLAADLGVRDDPRAPDVGGAEEDEEEAEDEPDCDVVGGKARLRTHGPGGGASADLERPAVTFAGVGGMEHVKDEIRMKIIHPLKHPEIYAAYGKTVGGGILLYGPPGCGKTFLARATAGEVKGGFVAVGIHEVLDMWIGQSERNLHAIFELARANKPCVIFFDEVDALGASRKDLQHSSSRQLINQFLAELDGVKSANDGLLILAATNAPWHIDPAFRRPGRFDRIVFVPPPDEPARAAILRIHLQGKPVETVDHEQLARRTEGFSGADLKAVVDTAVEEKLRLSLARGIPAPLTNKDLLAAAKRLKPTTKEWFATARNYALYSNQGGVYDDIVAYLKLR